MVGTSDHRNGWVFVVVVFLRGMEYGRTVLLSLYLVLLSLPIAVSKLPASWNG